jgi:hypothetical protein
VSELEQALRTTLAAHERRRSVRARLVAALAELEQLDDPRAAAVVRCGREFLGEAPAGERTANHDGSADPKRVSRRGE